MSENYSSSAIRDELLKEIEYIQSKDGKSQSDAERLEYLKRNNPSLFE